MSPSVVSDLLTFHHVITRGMKVSLERGRAFSRSGFPDAETKRGFLDFARCTAIVTRAHHDTEDALVFPAFRSRLPGIPYDELDQQHEELLPLLEAVGRGVEAGDKGLPERDWLPALAESLHRVLDLWERHIEIEERHFTEEAVGEKFPPAEQEELGRKFAEHGQKLAQPPPLILPFVLFNLEPAERAALSAKLPPPVTQLVATAWAPTWAAMKPFLLA